jgi:transcriptional regulator with XRE-family HTH domain
MVTPEEYRRVRSLLQLAVNSYGMSGYEVARLTGTHQTTVGRIVAGLYKAVHRETYDKLMQLVPQAPARVTARAGSRVDPRCTMRRLQALNAVGFNCQFLGEMLDVPKQTLSMIVRGERAFVYGATAASVTEIYDKLAFADPVDHGISPARVKISQTFARKSAYAPPWAWDEDTLNDPEAHPEWTGACGTEEGYRIHIRETLFNGNPLPLCGACRAAVETVEYVETVVFRRDRFAELLEERGLNPRQLAIKIWGAEMTPDQVRAKADAIYRWRDGSRSPRYHAQVLEITQALEVPLAELLDVEAAERASTRPVLGDGQFNPYVLRVALEMAGLSRTAAAELPGSTVRKPMIDSWLRGIFRPSDPAKLQAIADHLGISTEEFYT